MNNNNNKKSIEFISISFFLLQNNEAGEFQAVVQSINYYMVTIYFIIIYLIDSINIIFI